MEDTIEGSSPNEVIKPSVLYHASVNRKIEILEPRGESIRHPEEGPVVFASRGKPYQFLVPSDDSWTRKSGFNGVQVHVISDQERYEREDKGGAIYYLDSATFNNDYPKYGGGRGEWTSKVAVKPFKKEEYASGLQAQLENDIQIYFVDKETFDKITQASDHGKSIIKSLVSENSIRGINPIDIPDQIEGPLDF